MDWDDLRYALALQQAGNLTTAARALGVTRTTVGRRLQEIEARLGVRLFDRTPEGLLPTAAGEALAQAAARVEGEVLTVQSQLLGQDAALRGRLRVSTLGLIFEGFSDVFVSFMERYPGVDLTVQVTPEQVSLVRREADVALRLGNRPAEHLYGRRVGRLQFRAYAARSLVERIGAQAPLSAFPWLHDDERNDGRWLDAWLADNAPGARVVFRCEDYHVLRRALIAGVGVHFLPCFEGDSHPALVPLGPRLLEFGRELWALTLPDLRHTLRVRAFMDHVHAALADRQALMEGRD
jgi:DNA-binding transcriptional LysR family regulator